MLSISSTVLLLDCLIVQLIHWSTEAEVRLMTFERPRAGGEWVMPTSFFELRLVTCPGMYIEYADDVLALEQSIHRFKLSMSCYLFRLSQVLVSLSFPIWDM